MKIYIYTSIILFCFFLLGKGVNITEKFVKEGETFIFHLPRVESDSRSIKSAEWKQIERDKLLAIIYLADPTKTLIFPNESRLQFMVNGSVVIRGVTQGDTGNYTCNVVFEDNKIQRHIILLKLSPEIPERSANSNSSSEIPAQIPTHNSTSPPLVPQDFYILLIVLPAVGGLILLVGVTVIIFKCIRKCRSSAQEPIYMNSSCTETPKTLKKQAQMPKRRILT